MRYRSKREKKRKKKKRRRFHSDSNSSLSSSSDDNVPNSKRVRSSDYDATHLARLEEFRDEHKEFYRNGRIGWPSDDPLSFIVKKFARPGSTFASKGIKGIKCVFGANRVERDHSHTQGQIKFMKWRMKCVSCDRSERTIGGFGSKARRS